MNEQTYTASGQIDFKTNQLILSIALPEPPSRDSIVTTYYNLSKVAESNNTIMNVVLCEFTFDGDPGIALPTPTTDTYDVSVDLTKIQKAPGLAGVMNFDFNANSKCLFLFFHSTEANADDREAFFDDLESLYAKASGGAFVITAPVLKGKLGKGKPRQIGGVIF
jgi:hypothetical protein